MKPRAVKWLNKATQPGWGRLSSALASWHRSSLPTTPAGLPHTPQGPKHPLLLLPLQLWTPRRLFWSLAAYSCDLLLLGSMANAIVLAFLLLCPSAQSCMEKREEINPGHPGCLHRQCMPAALFKVKKKNSNNRKKAGLACVRFKLVLQDRFPPQSSGTAEKGDSRRLARAS